MLRKGVVAWAGFPRNGDLENIFSSEAAFGARLPLSSGVFDIIYLNILNNLIILT